MVHVSVEKFPNESALIVAHEFPCVQRLLVRDQDAVVT